MSTWIDWIVVTIIAVIGLFIMYRALKEPLDLLFGLIGKGLIGIKDWIIGMNQEKQYEVIRYG
jgi:hypothetical protein